MEVSRVSFIVFTVFSLIFALTQAQSASPAPSPTSDVRQLEEVCPLSHGHDPDAPSADPAAVADWRVSTLLRFTELALVLVDHSSCF
ncbi:hypothetical protein KSS87_000055 [Heliosperma pusillum]|nr:hypothetical protein KSS87_000055 [Heliosperma pusillum]